MKKAEYVGDIFSLENLLGLYDVLSLLRLLDNVFVM